MALDKSVVLLVAARPVAMNKNLGKTQRDEEFGCGVMKKNEEKFCTLHRDQNAHFGSDLVFWLDL